MSVGSAARPFRALSVVAGVGDRTPSYGGDGTFVVTEGSEHTGLLCHPRPVPVTAPETAGETRDADPFRHPFPLAGRAVKRGLDVVLAIIGLLLALPVLLVALIAVWYESPGPVVFRQVRVGDNGRPFRLYKIRTMRRGMDDAPHRAYQTEVIQGTAGPREGMFKLTDDPRITRVGQLLRRFSIDELPQLWNVLRGDMSMVGPRPALPWEVELYSEEAWQRLRVKPGLTGLWQVSGRSLLPFHEMVALDVAYWKTWTLRLDLLILLKTPSAVLRAIGSA